MYIIIIIIFYFKCIYNIVVCHIRRERDNSAPARCCFAPIGWAHKVVTSAWRAHTSVCSCHDELQTRGSYTQTRRSSSPDVLSFQRAHKAPRRPGRGNQAQPGHPIWTPPTQPDCAGRQAFHQTTLDTMRKFPCFLYKLMIFKNK